MKLESIKKKLKGFGRVNNMTSSRGNEVPNQFETTFNNGRLFQSYSSIIALQVNGKTYLTKDWDYSQTTGKYRNQFLNETKTETLAKIKKGTYILLED